MLSGIEKTAIAKRTFTASLDGIKVKEYHEGDIISGPIEVVNDIIANGWAKATPSKATPEAEEFQSKMEDVPENKGIGKKK